MVDTENGQKSKMEKYIKMKKKKIQKMNVAIMGENKELSKNEQTNRIKKQKKTYCQQSHWQLNNERKNLSIVLIQMSMTSGTYLPQLTKWPNLGEDSSHSDIFKSSNEGNEKYRRLCNLIKKKSFNTIVL